MDSNVAMPTLCTFHRVFLEKSAAENKGIALKSDRTFSRAVWRVLSNLSFWELTLRGIPKRKHRLEVFYKLIRQMFNLGRQA